MGGARLWTELLFAKRRPGDQIFCGAVPAAVAAAVAALATAALAPSALAAAEPTALAAASVAATALAFAAPALAPAGYRAVRGSGCGLLPGRQRQQSVEPF